MYAQNLLELFHQSTSALTAEPIIFDSFAGGGGASTGIEMALGRSPDIAINHNAAALALHAVNHPETLHVSENVYRVDPLDHLRGRHVGLGWFSPDCKDFSKAKGGTPVSKNIRDLAWIIPGWTERIQQSGGKVDVIIMENVEEFAQWGPVMETDRGLMPDPERRGETFRKWCRKLRSLGGTLKRRELRGCDYGAPTIRKRLFIVIRFDGKPIVWPKPTHGAPDDRDVIAGRKLPWRTAAEIIDWSIPCPSIFDTLEEILALFGLRAVRPLAAKTMSRLARGVHRYVLEALRPFLVNLTHGARCEDIAKPFNTITGAHRGEKAVISPSVIRFNGGATGQDCREPISTITANSFKKRPGGAAPLGVVAPILSYAQQGGRSRPVDQPAHTICASAKDQNQVAAAFIAQHNNDSRRVGGVNPGRPADAPMATITATGAQQGVVSAFISRQFGTSTGHAADAPLGTITADGQGKSAVVAPFLQKYYGADQDPRMGEPLHTITARDRFGYAEAILHAPPFTSAMEARARAVADFMRAEGFWDEREFVTLDIGGATFVIVDIGMRMLTPRELYNAQGFPADYAISHDAEGRPFSKSVQISCVGNSVCPPVAAALVAANCGHLVRERERVAA